MIVGLHIAPDGRRGTRRIAALAAAGSAAVLLTLATAVYAVGLEKLVMPGRVIEGHAEVEGDCAACHDTQSDLAQASLCIACHEDIGTDRQTASGFHGRFEPSRRNECVICHTDHEGRDADIVPVDAGVFDHGISDFPLLGAHIGVSCGDCHAPDDKHRDARSACAACHAGDDVHDGSLGDDCQACHGDRRWSETGFDHDAVGYRLTGKHRDVECVDCHRGNVFDGTPTQCMSCHAVDDVHGGSNGPACHDCHSTSTWRSIGFDHLAETGFALTDGHGGLDCQDCHTREDFKDGLVGACASCHLSEDDHQGRNGDECETCHVATSWSDSVFDHGDTDFALHDSHAALHCTACHKDSADVSLPLECGGCHALDDSHGGQMGEECGTCHQQTSWHAAVAFDHDLSSFPLTGMHATAPCGSCHESNRFNDASPDCASCHRADDVHEGSLGTACGACHTSNEWPVAVFDHDTQTGFPLDGAHGSVDCSGCHRDSSADMADVPSTCAGCHRTDDVHGGRFGPNCGQCHSTASFSDVEAL